MYVPKSKYKIYFPRSKYQKYFPNPIIKCTFPNTNIKCTSPYQNIKCTSPKSKSKAISIRANASLLHMYIGCKTAKQERSVLQVLHVFWVLGVFLLLPVLFTYNSIGCVFYYCMYHSPITTSCASHTAVGAVIRCPPRSLKYQRSLVELRL